MVTGVHKRVLSRFFLVIFFTSLFLGLFSTFALSEDVNIPQVKDKVFVYDMENVIDSKTEEDLNSIIRYLEEKTSIEFAVITTSSFNNKTIEDYAHDLFNKLGIGKSGKDNGILYLVSVSEGHARLEIGYGLESILTDGICGQILDNYYVPNRDSKKVKESITDTVNGVLAILGNEYKVELVKDQETIVKSVKEKKSINIWIIILVIIVCIFIFSLEEGSSSSGGGFFGGGSSSSGGGFGGGFSGGGGASR